MLFCRQNLTAEGLIPRLWDTGRELLSGGLLSGATAHGFMAVLGKPASVIIFCLLIVVLLLVVFQVSPATLLRLWRERDRLDYRVEDYEDEEDDEDFSDDDFDDEECTGDCEECGGCGMDEDDENVYVECMCPNCQSTFYVLEHELGDGVFHVCPRCGEKIHVEPDYDEEIPVAKLADKDPDEE